LGHFFAKISFFDNFLIYHYHVSSISSFSDADKLITTQFHTSTILLKLIFILNQWVDNNLKYIN
jgi:hypothetical protein